MFLVRLHSKADIGVKNGNRVISRKLVAGEEEGMDGSGPGGDSRDEEERMDSQVFCEERLWKVQSG